MATVPVPGLEHGPKWVTVGTFLSGQRTVGLYGGENLFGQVSALPGAVSRAVTGVGSAQAFGAVQTAFTLHPAGLGSAQLFGTVTYLAGPTARSVAGVPSAQAFGTPRVFRVFLLPSPPETLILIPSEREELTVLATVEGELTIGPALEEESALVPTVEEEMLVAPAYKY